MNKLGTLTHNHFKPEVGNMFTLDTVRLHQEGDMTPAPVQIKLLRMEEGKPTLKDFRLPFSLFFGTPRNTLLIEGHYAMTSESGHRFEMHMSPIMSPVGEYQLYQAVFN